MKVVAAILPTRSPEIFGVLPKPEHFRFSRTKGFFVLNEDSGIAVPKGDDEDTVGLGERGIMQQINLEGLDDLLNEMAYMAARYPQDYHPIHELLQRFVHRRSLVGRDLERLREMLEFYMARRPTGKVMEVRSPRLRRGSFWPSQHPDGIWCRGANGCIGADEQGVFFRDSSNHEYFRSMIFLQERIDRFRYTLIDKPTKRRVESPICVCDCWYDDQEVAPVDPNGPTSVMRLMPPADTAPVEIPESHDIDPAEADTGSHRVHHDAHPTPVLTHNGTAKLISGMLPEVVLSCFNFKDEIQRLINQLYTMSKLGVIIGQPILMAEGSAAQQVTKY